MYQLSDVESTDSEDGIRFKTESTRSKSQDVANKERSKFKSRGRNEYSRLSPESRRHERRCRRSRSRTPVKKYRRPRSKSTERTQKQVKQKCSHHKTNTASRTHSPDSNKHKKETPEQELKNPDSTVIPDHILGPALPPHLQTNKEEIIENNSSLVGPALPIYLSKNTQNNEQNKTESTIIGPILPVLDETSSESTSNQNPPPCIGPFIPPEFRKVLEQNATTIPTDPIDPIDEDEALDDIYGPLPPNLTGNSKAHIALEERALKIKIDQLNPTQDKDSREEWMLELPQVHGAKLGLGPRQFRAKAGPDLSDRSSWTDTPENKAKKLAGEVVVAPDVKKEAEIEEMKRRDSEQEKLITKHKKKRKDKSLLELHQDKARKKKSKEQEEGTSTRRPFNRDIDLKVNQFDEAQKKSILKKAQLLDDRFSSGQSKFL